MRKDKQGTKDSHGSTCSAALTRLYSHKIREERAEEISEEKGKRSGHSLARRKR